VWADLPQPDKKKVFLEDLKTEEDLKEDTRAKARKPDADAHPDLEFQAPKMEVLKDTNEVKGEGGVLISRGGVQVQADSGQMNTETKTGEVHGNVLMTSPDGVFAADHATLNIDSETGDFAKAEFTLEEGGYDVNADEAIKISEFEFNLRDAHFSTCHCLDGAKPWEIVAGTGHITQEGYAHTYDTTFYFEGLPIFYTPWMVFPAKTQRASGLLAPEWGLSSEDGFQYTQPLFLNIDDSTDVTVSPFIQTSSRVGSKFSFRDVISTTSEASGELIYSNESRRGSSLRGLDLTGFTDPTIDTNRFGAFYNHVWKPDPKENLPIEFVADGHYVSDDLFLREIEDDDIGLRESTFLTSTAVLRGRAFDKVTLEARGEYTQLILEPDEQQFQRAPELAASSTHTFRPFGFNPYGIKLVTSGSVVGTDFVRDLGYEGQRVNFKPKVQVPFHFENYVRGQLAAELNQTQYHLSDNLAPDGTTELETDNSRTLPILGYGMSTGVERVYSLDRGSWFPKLANLGAQNENLELVRLKHTIEPTVQYTFVPDVSQDDLPQFDSTDRYKNRSLFVYGLKSHLYGRMVRPYERSRDVGELAPAPDTLPMYDLSDSLVDFGRDMVLTPGAGDYTRRDGEVRDLATFTIKQSYDYIEDHKNLDPNVDAFSDVFTGLTLSPSSYFSFGFGSDYDAEDGGFSDYDVRAGFRDDRDDALRTKYTFIDNALSDVEGNIELKLIDELRLGYYARFDELHSEIVESRAVIRLTNPCKCWHLDLGFSDTSNPDKQQVLITFTFGGLGDISQNFGLPQDREQQ